MPKITIEWQRFGQLSAAGLYELLRFRQSIFVVEQRSPYPDLDGLDQQAWHLLLWADGTLAGYLRLAVVPGQPPQLNLGRIAVAIDLRRCGLGRMMVKEALSWCREHYPGQPLTLGAQLHLVPFYGCFGFTRCSEPYDDFGVVHLLMSRPPDQVEP
jgi:ElaA protein